MTKSNNNSFIASIVRWASLALFIAIALRTMGIANEIVELAFGLILGALAVAFALSYGLGGREAAGEHFREIIQKFKDDSPNVETPKVTPRNPDTNRNFNQDSDRNDLNRNDDLDDSDEPRLNL